MKTYLFLFTFLFLQISYAQNSRTLITQNKTEDESATKKTKSLAECISGDCKNGYGIYKYKNGDEYFGNFLNEKRSGYGTYLYASGDLYIGFYKDNNKNGFGSYLWKNENFYKGNWKNNKMDGFGTNHFKRDKIAYTGEWKNNVINGYGYKYSTNEPYKYGVWHNGSLISSFSYTQNNITSGCVNGDCANGYGKFIYKNGNSFEGFFVNKGSIIGTFNFTNGDKYIGEFNSYTNFEGTGFYSWKNGNTFHGEWVNGKRNNWGVASYNKKGDFTEKWVDGVKISSEKIK